MNNDQKRLIKKAVGIVSTATISPRDNVVRVLNAEERARNAERENRELQRILDVFVKNQKRLIILLGMLVVRIKETDLSSIRESGECSFEISKDDLTNITGIGVSYTELNKLPIKITLFDGEAKRQDHVEANEGRP